LVMIEEEAKESVGRKGQRIIRRCPHGRQTNQRPRRNVGKSRMPVFREEASAGGGKKRQLKKGTGEKIKSSR